MIPEGNKDKIMPFQGCEINQNIILRGGQGQEHVFLRPTLVDNNPDNPRLVLEGTTPKVPSQINGRVRKDYYQHGDRVFEREQIFSEVGKNSVLNQLVIKCNRGPVDISYYVVEGGIGVTPRLVQDPKNYNLYIDVRASNRCSNRSFDYPPLAQMQYKYPPQSNYPYRGFLLDGEFANLISDISQRPPKDRDDSGEYLSWRKLRYYFAMGRGWRVLDEKIEDVGHGVPPESYKDVIANSTRRSRVPTSEYAFKVRYKRGTSHDGRSITLERFNPETKSRWEFAVPLWDNRAEVIQQATLDNLEEFLYCYPV